MKTENAIVLFSGGQDSTTCLFWAKEKFKQVETICFSYGQRHSKEVEVARSIAQQINVPITIIDANVISTLSPNALTNKTIEMDKEKPNETYPNTFVPARNLIFLSFIGAIAYTKSIKHIVTGVSQADYSGYPDCREEFIQSANQTLNLAMDKNFVIHTPLMHLDKTQVWQLADQLNVLELIKNQTLTCYNGIIAEGCGQCPACLLRKNGLTNYLNIRKKQ